MKFLCVNCDAQMRLVETVAHQDIGSLSVVYACPQCSQKTAMLTNRHETQLVTSLGVKIGPGAAHNGESKEAGKCPFANMLASEGPAETKQRTGGQQPLQWSPEAAERLARIPELLRPMVQSGIERYAREHGQPIVTGAVLDEAKEAFGVETT